MKSILFHIKSPGTQKQHKDIPECSFCFVCALSVLSSAKKGGGKEKMNTDIISNVRTFLSLQLGATTDSLFLLQHSVTLFHPVLLFVVLTEIELIAVAYCSVPLQL